MIELLNLFIPSAEHPQGLAKLPNAPAAKHAGESHVIALRIRAKLDGAPLTLNEDGKLTWLAANPDGGYTFVKFIENYFQTSKTYGA